MQDDFLTLNSFELIALLDISGNVKFETQVLPLGTSPSISEQIKEGYISKEELEQIRTYQPISLRSK